MTKEEKQALRFVGTDLNYLKNVIESHLQTKSDGSLTEGSMIMLHIIRHLNMVVRESIDKGELEWIEYT